MRNPVIGVGAFGKVYKRKIDVYISCSEGWRYCYSTDAYKTCWDAVQSAKLKAPNFSFKANFSKCN
jgi:hypothetical protein